MAKKDVCKFILTQSSNWLWNSFIIMVKQTLIRNYFYVNLKEKSPLFVINKTLNKIYNYPSNFLPRIWALI